MNKIGFVSFLLSTLASYTYVIYLLINYEYIFMYLEKDSYISFPFLLGTISLVITIACLISIKNEIKIKNIKKSEV